MICEHQQTPVTCDKCAILALVKDNAALRKCIAAAIAAMPPIKLPQVQTWFHRLGDIEAYDVDEVKAAIEAAGLRWEES